MPQIRHLKLSLIATLALVGFIDVSRASAQDKAARGKATVVTNVSLTIKVGDRYLTFARLQGFPIQARRWRG